VSRTLPALLLGLATLTTAFGQTNTFYVTRTVAGVFPMGDGGPATAALLDEPLGMVVDASGNLYIADHLNGVIRKVTPDGRISTVAGYLGDPVDVKLDSAGNLYIAESTRILKLTPAGVLSTVAGGTDSGYSGDGGPATQATFAGIWSIAFDSAGNLFISDSDNNRIRKVARDGTVSTVVGTRTGGLGGDGGLATAASLRSPLGIAFDLSGNLFIADYENWRVRKVTPAGIISTIGGGPTQMIDTAASPDGPATKVPLVPRGIAVDQSGRVYITEHYYTYMYDQNNAEDFKRGAMFEEAAAQYLADGTLLKIPLY